MSSIKAIIWDFAGVVLMTVKGTFNSLLAERLGVSLSAVENAMAMEENDQWDMDEINDDAFYAFLLNELNLPKEKEAIIRRFVLKDFYIDKELLAYIKRLKKKYVSVLLTNFPAHIHDFMKTDWIVDGAFDQMIASCDVKLLKPDPAIYNLTLDRIGYKAEECVFIDDRPVNVNAAEALGINGVLYQERDQAIEEINQILLSN